MITGDYQLMFEDYYTGDMIVLGGEGAYCSVNFDGIGSADLRDAVRELPSEDGVTFGFEFLGMRKWTIKGSIKNGSGEYASSPESAWDSLSQIMRAWDYNRSRLTAREVVPLYFKRPGRDTMIVYGRPDRIDPDVGRSYAGYVSYQAAFRQSDPKFYSDDIHSLTLSIDTPYVGGLLLTDLTGDSLGTMTNAFEIPFTTTATTGTADLLQHAGDADSPLIITINGDVINPRLRLVGSGGSTVWEIKLTTTIDAGASVTIDTRQWKRSIVRDDGATMAGTLVGNRLAELVVPPGGPYEVQYSGQSTGGNSSCEITYRNAWTAL